MKRIKNSDINFKINPKRINLNNFSMKFYTVNSEAYFFTKDQNNLVSVERDATIYDEDVIISGGTKVLDYYLPLDWSELVQLGEGVLNYRCINNIEDPYFPDMAYNQVVEDTTGYYIDSDIIVDPSQNRNIIERVSELESGLAVESIDREEADTAISGAVDSEIARAISAETILQEEIDELASGTSEALDAEIERAISAETAIRQDLTDESELRSSADTAMWTAINDEITRSTSADTALDNKIDVETLRAIGVENAISGNLETYKATNNAALQAETTRATSAETALQTAIGDEATARANADTALSTRIDNLTSASTAAIEAEAARAQEAESGLTNAINNEVTRATSAETIIANSLNAEINRASSAETALNNQIDAEVLRATAREAELEAKIGVVSGVTELINAETLRATTAEEALQTAIGNEVSARTDADTALDNKIDTVSGNVLTEEARAKGIENALSGAIDTLDVRFFDDAKYEMSGQTHVINFYNGNVVKATIDATDFIKDGMISTVELIPSGSTSVLVITWNTDGGSKVTTIDIGDIFEADNYYQKSETSGKTEIANALALKLNIADFNTYSGNVYTKSETSGATQISTALADKLDVTAYTPTDLSNYYTKSETSGKTEISTALAGKLDATALTPSIESAISGKANSSDVYTTGQTSGATELATAFAATQPKLTAGSGITIDTANTISCTVEGGGKAIEPGRGISVTTGETADTVSVSLPISAGTGTGAIIEGHQTRANGYYSHAEGYQTTAANNYAHAEGLGTQAGDKAHAEGYYTNSSGEASHAEGYQTHANNFGSHAEGHETFATASYSHAEGEYTRANGYVSHAEGYYTTASTSYTHAEGYYTIANNSYEHASGQYNVSNKASNTFGDSGNTLFSVGNGTANNARHNALEVRQNGDIYITKDGSDVKLQDQLGGGGGEGISSAECQTMIDNSISGKVNVSDNIFSGYTHELAATDVWYEININSNSVRTLYLSGTTGDGQVYVQTNIWSDNLATFNFDENVPTNEYCNITYDSTSNTYTINIKNEYADSYFISAYYVNVEGGKLWCYDKAITSGQSAAVLNEALPDIYDSFNDKANNSSAVKFGSISVVKGDSTSWQLTNSNIAGNYNNPSFEVCDNKGIVMKDSTALSLGTLHTISGHTKEWVTSDCIYSVFDTDRGVPYNEAINSFTATFNTNYVESTSFDFNAFYKTADGYDETLAISFKKEEGTIYVAGNYVGDWTSDLTAANTAILSNTGLHLGITQTGVTYIKGASNESFIEYVGFNDCVTYGNTYSLFSSIISSQNKINIYDAVDTLFANYETGSTGGGISSAQCQTLIDQSISGKADSSTVDTLSGTVTANTADIATVSGNVNTISGDVATNTSNIATVSAATASNTTALGGLKLVKLSQTQYDSLQTKDNNTLYVIVG